jgi:hypothetical protein
MGRTLVYKLLYSLCFEIEKECAQYSLDVECPKFGRKYRYRNFKLPTHNTR